MEFAQLSIELILFLLVISALAGFIDSLAGGGGLIVLPALIISGVSPLAALGTNKLQGTMGTATAALMMFKSRTIHFETIKYLMLSAFIGAVVGTVIVQFIDTRFLSFIIPAVLLFIGLYFLFAPTPQNDTTTPVLSSRKYNRLIVPSIGCYDGMFGPGTGSFFTLAGVSLKGRNLIASTAEAKPLNFATNIASLIVFIVAGKVVWAIGFIMMFGQVIGAWAGSHCLLSINPKYLRVLVVVMCFGMLIKYSASMGWLGDL